MAAETWKPIPGFDGYSVSNHGLVLSTKRGKPRIMRPARDSCGYPILALRQNGRLVTRRAHILMMLAFVGPRPDGAIIRHIDGNPENNVLENLSYGTHSENGFDAVHHGTHTWASRTHCRNGHPYSPENTYHRLDRTGRLCRICRRTSSRKNRAGGQ